MDPRKNFALDVGALAWYAAVSVPALTGVSFHEWASLGLLVVLFVHLAAHLDWLAETVRGIASSAWPKRGRALLDALSFLLLAAVAVSGVMVSGSVLPSLGWFAGGYFLWNPVHAISAKVLMALVIVHVALHGKWLLSHARSRKGGLR